MAFYGTEKQHTNCVVMCVQNVGGLMCVYYVLVRAPNQNCSNKQNEIMLYVIVTPFPFGIENFNDVRFVKELI